jgi:predicted DNA-binding transcriptional regulator YafY
MSTHEAESLNHGVHVAGRIKTQNESIYYILNDIQRAISDRLRITFKYYDYDLKKNRVARKDGKEYIADPVGLTYSNENYYLISFNSKYDDFVTYRVDRMMGVKITSEKIARLPADKKRELNEFCDKAFSMYSGRDMRVTLSFHKSVTNQIIDRFGRDVLIQIIDDDSARIHIPVSVSKTFFGWLTQFDGLIWIEAPDELIGEYTDYLKQLILDYEEA